MHWESFACSWRPWILVAMLAVSILARAEQPTSTPAATKANTIVRESVGVRSDSNTPTDFPGAQTYIYRELKPEPLRLFVVRPEGWRTTDHRPALIYFFGGGWTRGDPGKSIGWARMAAYWGMVGIAPDYRTADRFGTTPVEATADARAATRWVEDHATELGIDAGRIVVAGTSAGGHLALWTAIEKAPFGSNPEESPTIKPVALVLISAPSDTTPATWDDNPKFLKRFGPHIGDVSPLQHLDAAMPPIIMFHGDADPTVSYRIPVALHDKLVANSNVCEFITIPGGGHGIGPDWKDKSRSMIKEFLTRQKILPVSGS
jgi:acetyl esterase